MIYMCEQEKAISQVARQVNSKSGAIILKLVGCKAKVT